MKSKNSDLFLIGIFLFLMSSSLSGQMVGIGTTTDSKAPKEKIKIDGFFIKFGAAIPSFNFFRTPTLSTSPPNYWAQMPISDGSMGAINGIQVETGFALAFPSQNEKTIRFYFYPIVLSYMQNGLDWSTRGGFFSDQSIYTNPYNAFDVGQRYGLTVQVLNPISISLYYRPGLVLSLPFEVLHMNDTNGELFQMAGVMSIGNYAPIFQMSHAAGLEFKYKFISLSAELYHAQPTFDVTYIDNQAREPIDYRIRGKIPINLLNLSLAVNF